MEKRSIVIDGLIINYYQSPDFNGEKSLIFLHGWKSEAIIYRKVLERCKNFAALDLPGFGGSEKPDSAWPVSEYAGFLRKFILKLGVKRPILIGHSFGAGVAIKYNSLFNEVEKNIFIGAAGIRKKTLRLKIYKLGAKIFGLAGLIPGLGRWHEKTRRNFYKSINSVDYLDSGDLRETYEKIISEDLSGDMQKIKTETVLIWGDNDKDVPVENGEAMEKIIKKSKLIKIKNAGHYVFLEQPEKFAKVFFKEIC